MFGLQGQAQGQAQQGAQQGGQQGAQQGQQQQGAQTPFTFGQQASQGVQTPFSFGQQAQQAPQTQQDAHSTEVCGAQERGQSDVAVKMSCRFCVYTMPVVLSCAPLQRDKTGLLSPRLTGDCALP
ncbi:MAG: uncharacterized protein A8A55_2965 [Amphiamblys sp. WSBS2006]|nr:MAG: uncharacterized protein A8A55_2965 [Amphiamblys sp. WSBS2006]